MLHRRRGRGSCSSVYDYSLLAQCIAIVRVNAHYTRILMRHTQESHEAAIRRSHSQFSQNSARQSRREKKWKWNRNCESLQFIRSTQSAEPMRSA